MNPNQIFYVEGRELRALNGWDLKVYILVANSPKPLTCKQIAATLGVSHERVWLSLRRLVERCYLRRVEEGTYAISHYPYTPLKNSQIFDVR